MANETIPDDVREFLHKYIDSIAQLEALLLLRREISAPWDVAMVAKRLYVSNGDASDVLRRLLAHGFLKLNQQTYQYQCPEELDSLVGHVADVYGRQLIPVTNFIHNKPARIQEFADAFKLRKEPK
jgi:hypothetical protein